MKYLEVCVMNRMVLLVPFPLPSNISEAQFEELLGRSIWNELKEKIRPGREDFFQLKFRID